ncbi:MAG: hypothetical protein COS47_00695 [Candidatus Nealsonbacteria bacterium CG03_land_8_20_14_0_80_36_12]|uniref:Antitoxin n=1 Tax=Candidatus Nealsonbacteria bacterium CG03_land_8_20_14_0_80_36_12 TaxID=1974701 RepID=A0A2M7BYM1_9BACT|nr:MAG: hypothetical protein COS47_00695 [Candidatus Nealsonbacteria bacterium CG03_land_8_20_14_0_80_36_12]
MKEKGDNMDLNEIKNIIEVDGGKFIIIEEGKPTLLIMSFEDYKKSLKSKEQKELLVKEDKSSFPPFANARVEKEKTSSTPPPSKEELTIEDLPF